MRYFISLLFILFATGCASIQAAPTAARLALDAKYMNTKTAIVIRCGQDAEHIKEIADFRDSGNSRRDVVNVIVEVFAEESIKSTVSPPLTIENVIEEITLITIIFSNPEQTGEELFKNYYDYCVDDLMGLLDMAYSYDKQELKTHE